MSKKNSFENIPYFRTPHWMMKEELSKAAWKVWASLSARANSEGRAWPQHKTIAEDTSMSISSVKRGVEELKRLKVISVMDRGWGKSNLYTLTPDRQVGVILEPPSNSEQSVQFKSDASIAQVWPLDSSSLNEVSPTLNPPVAHTSGSYLEPRNQNLELEPKEDRTNEQDISQTNPNPSSLFAKKNPFHSYLKTPRGTIDEGPS